MIGERKKKKKPEQSTDGWRLSSCRGPLDVEKFGRFVRPFVLFAVVWPPRNPPDRTSKELYRLLYLYTTSSIIIIVMRICFAVLAPAPSRPLFARNPKREKNQYVPENRVNGTKPLTYITGGGALAIWPGCPRERARVSLCRRHRYFRGFRG